jgi:tetratricopeptide (TPR) repeat protein
MGRDAEAEQAYNRARELSAERGQISHREIKPTKTKEQWVEEGNAHRRAARYTEALTAYEQALQLDLRYTKAWYGRGFALNGLKKNKEALVAYDQALQVDPQYADAWFFDTLPLKRRESLLSFSPFAPCPCEHWRRGGLSRSVLPHFASGPFPLAQRYGGRPATPGQP